MYKFKLRYIFILGEGGVKKKKIKGIIDLFKENRNCLKRSLIFLWGCKEGWYGL